MRHGLGIELGDQVLVAGTHTDPPSIVPIGRDGALSMPGVQAEFPDGRLILGEEAEQFVIRGGSFAVVTRLGDLTTNLAAVNGSRLGRLAENMVAEAAARATRRLGGALETVVVAAPTWLLTGGGDVVQRLLRRHVARARPLRLVDGPTAAVEYLRHTGVLHASQRVVVVHWRDGPPDVALVTDTSFGALSVPVVIIGIPGETAALAAALRDFVTDHPGPVGAVVLVGERANHTRVVDIVVRTLPGALIVPASADVIALGAAVISARLDAAAPPAAFRPAPAGFGPITGDVRPLPAGAGPPRPELPRTPFDWWDKSAPTPPTAPAEQPQVVDKDAQFTIYKPRTVRPETWERMVAFVHKSDVYLDADGQQVDPLAVVKQEAAALLGDRSRQFHPVTADSTIDLVRGDTLRFVPEIPGVEFEPRVREFRWLLPVHHEDFLLFADRRLDGTTVRGHVSIYLGPVLIAEVALTLRVDSTRPHLLPEASRASTYRRIFPSYSHQDAVIVDGFARYAAANGDEFLRDVDRLRSGQVWSEEIERLIRDADVFQLYWSSHSMMSEYVAKEYEYALALNRPHFVRPLYWEEPLPNHVEKNLPPAHLARLHFRYLAMTDSTARVAPPTQAGARFGAFATPPPLPTAFLPAPRSADVPQAWTPADPLPPTRGGRFGRVGQLAAVIGAAAVITTITVIGLQTAGDTVPGDAAALPFTTSSVLQPPTTQSTTTQSTTTQTSSTAPTTTPTTSSPSSTSSSTRSTSSSPRPSVTSSTTSGSTPQPTVTASSPAGSTPQPTVTSSTTTTFSVPPVTTTPTTSDDPSSAPPTGDLTTAAALASDWAALINDGELGSAANYVCGAEQQGFVDDFTAFPASALSVQIIEDGDSVLIRTEDLSRGPESFRMRPTDTGYFLICDGELSSDDLSWVPG